MYVINIQNIKDKKYFSDLKNLTSSVNRLHITQLKDLYLLKDFKCISFDTDMWLSDSKKGLLNFFIKEENKFTFKQITFDDNLYKKKKTGAIVSKNKKYINPLLDEAKRKFNIEFEDFYNSKREESLILMNLCQLNKLSEFLTYFSDKIITNDLEGDSALNKEK